MQHLSGRPEECQEGPGRSEGVCRGLVGVGERSVFMGRRGGRSFVLLPLRFVHRSSVAERGCGWRGGRGWPTRRVTAPPLRGSRSIVPCCGGFTLFLPLDNADPFRTRATPSLGMRSTCRQRERLTETIEHSAVQCVSSYRSFVRLIPRNKCFAVRMRLFHAVGETLDRDKAILRGARATASSPSGPVLNAVAARAMLPALTLTLASLGATKVGRRTKHHLRRVIIPMWSRCFSTASVTVADDRCKQNWEMCTTMEDYTPSSLLYLHV